MIKNWNSHRITRIGSRCEAVLGFWWFECRVPVWCFGYYGAPSRT